MKKIAHLLMGRLTIVGVSILLQICWLFLVLWKFSYQFTYANLIIRAAAIVLVLVIANKWENPANKLSWTFLILLSPILGIMLYFLFGRSGLTKHTREQMDAVNRKVDACMPVDEEAVRLLQEADPSSYDSQNILRTGDIFRSTGIPPQSIMRAGRRCSRICLQRWRARNTLFFWSISSSRRDICSTRSRISWRKRSKRAWRYA